jgi:hypothetical protein
MQLEDEMELTSRFVEERRPDVGEAVEPSEEEPDSSALLARRLVAPNPATPAATGTT